MIANERKRIAHLLRRAGFGASKKELDHYAGMGFEATLKTLLDSAPLADDYPVDPAIAQLFRTDPKQARMLAGQMVQELPLWWVKRMVATPNPLEEKMTLFWHGHFTSQASKVQDGRMMLWQNQLLRRHALGNFGNLTQEITQDPAMLQYLDNASNRRGNPNENYARELMELFTIGIGNFTETDVKEAARALTGWQLDRETATARFNSRIHDGGTKSFLGETGDLRGEDIVNTVVDHPATGPRLARKLFTFFVHENPSAQIIDRLAQTYYSSGFDLRAVLEQLFSSPEFSSDEAYRALVKSPAELVAGSVKALGIQSIDQRAPRIMRQLGQVLFDPPSVKGWDGNRAWIGTSTLISRMNFAGVLVGARSSDGQKPLFAPPPEIVSLAASTPDALVDGYVDLLLDGDVPGATRAALVDYARASASRPNGAVRGVVRLIMSIPEYQLN